MPKFFRNSGKLHLESADFSRRLRRQQMNKCYNSVDLAEAVSSDLWSGSEDPVGADGTIKGVEEAAGASEGSTGGVAGAVGLAGIEYEIYSLGFLVQIWQPPKVPPSHPKFK